MPQKKQTLLRMLSFRRAKTSKWGVSASSSLPWVFKLEDAIYKGPSKKDADGPEPARVGRQGEDEGARCIACAARIKTSRCMEISPAFGEGPNVCLMPYSVGIHRANCLGLFCVLFRFLTSSFLGRCGSTLTGLPVSKRCRPQRLNL